MNQYRIALLGTIILILLLYLDWFLFCFIVWKEDYIPDEKMYWIPFIGGLLLYKKWRKNKNG